MAEKAVNTDQPALDKANEQGFLGDKVDPTPDAHYTVAGVVAGKPTPETDDKAAKKADEAKQS